jgi:CHAD domain-containing protein
MLPAAAGNPSRAKTLRRKAVVPLKTPARRKKTASKDIPRRAAKSPAWHKAAPVAFPKTATAEEAFAAIGKACRDHWHSNLPAAMAGEHPEGIHQVRVGFRRFRVLLSLYGDLLPPDQIAWLKTETKAFGDALGLTRDLDVFLTELMEPLARKAAAESDVAVLFRAARTARDRAHGEAVKLFTSRRYQRFMTRVNTWLSGAGWRTAPLHKTNDSAAHFAEAELNRRLDKITRRAKSIPSLTPEKLHRLRIAIKKLRYGLEFFHPVLPHRRTARTGRTLKALQDALGSVNDLDVAKRTITMLAATAKDAATRTVITRCGKRLTARFDTRSAKAVPAAARAAERLKHHKPF